MVAQRLRLLMLAVVAGLAVTGAGRPSEPVTGPENAPAAVAVEALTEEAALPAAALLASLPADFADVVGYVPDAVAGADGRDRLAKPNGGCSSPFGDSRYDFGAACKSHDLGYDLLRYATAAGGQLGPWARRAIDERFAADLRERCAVIDADASCTGLAVLSSAVVRANSWRQGYGNPGAERVLRYLVAAGLIVGALVGPGLIRRVRKWHGAGAVVGSVTR